MQSNDANPSETLEYAEVGDRLYEVAAVAGLEGDCGRHCRIDHDAQRIEIDAALPDAVRPRVVARAVNQILARLAFPWRLVPVLGRAC